MPWLLGKDWDQFYRVRLPDTGLADEKIAWCKKNVVPNHWAASFGQEVFYFLSADDAILFRLRWEGASK